MQSPISHRFTPVTLDNLNRLTQLDTLERFKKSFYDNPIAFFNERLKADFDTIKCLNDAIVTPEYAPYRNDGSNPDLDFIFDSPENYLSAFKALRYVFGQLYLSGHPRLNQSEETAVRCFNRAATVGCELSARAADTLILEGRGFSKRNFNYAKKTLETNGGDTAQCLLGILHNKTGQPQLAKRHFEQAFQKNPEAFLMHLVKYDYPSAFLLFDTMRDFTSSDAIERKDEIEKSEIPQFAFIWNSATSFVTAKKILNNLFGEMYLTGNDKVTQSDIEAALLFSVAAKLGYDSAQQKVTELYLQGRGFDTRTKNFAIAALQEASKSNPVAFFQLGVLYSKFNLTKEASTYFAQAAESKSPAVLHQLARLYLHGNKEARIEPDIKQAKYYAELAFSYKNSHKQTLRLLEEIHGTLGADINDPNILCQLGEMHLHEVSALISVKRRNDSSDFDALIMLERNKALTYLHKASLGSNPKAFLLLGNAYFQGIFSVDDGHEIHQPATQGTSVKPTNLLTAERYLKQAEESGIPEASDQLKALRSLRTWSWSLQFPFTVNTDKLPLKNEINTQLLPMHNAALEEAALAGYPDALFQAAMQDTGGPNESLLCAAAEKKHPEAAYQLGLLYHAKKDTWPLTKNQDKAIKWFEQAAVNSNNEHAAAIFQLTEIHFKRYSLSPYLMGSAHHRDEASKYYRIISNKFKGSDYHQTAIDKLNDLNPNKPLKAQTPLLIQ